MEIFLGGTTAEGTTWREILKPKLEKHKISYFDPIVDDWNEEAQELELQKRESCDFVLYVITPLMEGVYSIAEVVDDSNKRPEKTLFCILRKDGTDEYAKREWTKSQIKSLEMVEKMIEENGATVFDSLNQIAVVLSNIENKNTKL